MNVARFCAVLLLSMPAWAAAQGRGDGLDPSIISDRGSTLEVKLGAFTPLIDREAGLTGTPYEDTFGEKPMVLLEIQGDYMVFQGFGTASVGFSVGYAEKYARAVIFEDPGTGVEATPTTENTGFFVLPLRLLGVYRFDYPMHRWGVPVVPYLKGGLVYTPWWTTKGDELDTSGGQRGVGGKWGYGGTVGVSFLLDFLDPRAARTFDADMGVNHSYLFAEFTYADVNDFGGAGLDLSSRHFMFGLALDF